MSENNKQNWQNEQEVRELSLEEMDNIAGGAEERDHRREQLRRPLLRAGRADDRRASLG